ncbi:MAG: hypothetical protein IPJ37_17800 [Bacteroidales bacterium]|nr:hypothetical protein [Bacteroidales bacterium]
MCKYNSITIFSFWSKALHEWRASGYDTYTHTDTKIVGTTTILKITSDGYEDFNGVLVRNEEANVGAIIGGIFLLFPFLWVMDYKPMHNFELVPSKK